MGVVVHPPGRVQYILQAYFKMFSCRLIFVSNLKCVLVHFACDFYHFNSIFAHLLKIILYVTFICHV